MDGFFNHRPRVSGCSLPPLASLRARPPSARLHAPPCPLASLFPTLSSTLLIALPTDPSTDRSRSPTTRSSRPRPRRPFLWSPAARPPQKSRQPAALALCRAIVLTMLPWRVGGSRSREKNHRRSAPEAARSRRESAGPASQHPQAS